MNRIKTVIMLLTAASITAAQTSISGRMGDMTLDSAGNPYIVEKDITVPRGKTLTVKEGSVLIFKQFTGLIIQGSCRVNGTESHPVVFTSINDAAYNKTASQEAASFDWNGITVDKKSGQVEFNHAEVRFSVFGIKSQNSKIIIRKSIFSQNGQFHFTINDKIQGVQDNQAFSFNDRESVQTEASAGGGNLQKRKIIRYSLLGAGAACTIAGIIMSAKAASAYSDWSDLEQQTTPLPQPGEYEKRRDKYNSAFTGALILDILGGLGLAGFGVTFFF